MEELTLREVTEELFGGAAEEAANAEEPSAEAGEALFEEAGEETEEFSEELPGEEPDKEAFEEPSPEEIAAWEELAEAYPEITAENIPEDVFRLVAQGETPLQAMRLAEIAGLKAENKALKEKLAAAETARGNRLRTPGSMLGRAAEPEDAFLTGLEY